ncbi:hypothetical protein INT48_000586 [Thamnidium elegans]|uniref:Uncharacterized protein n=1 Tax=Thamnidium elegans TaxID=101142 RepID=A0A8H7SN54_9FUNG|nr:hypothetical protein INT48_000586 [Thamnidium elegans]
MGKPKEKFHYFDYDRLISIDFGSTLTKFAYYDIRNEKLELNYRSTCSNQPSACLYKITDNDLENAELKEWGHSAEFSRRNSPDRVYVDKLRDKVTELFKELPLSEPLDLFHERAIVDYFRHVDRFINSFINDKYGKNCDASKNRYVMTYPSDWCQDQIKYLRDLVIRAGVISEEDHPQRLIMYNEVEAILRYVQEDIKDRNGSIKLKQDHNYLICDLGGSEIKTHYYQMIGLIDGSTDIRHVKSQKWPFWNVEERVPEGGQHIVKKLEELTKFSGDEKQERYSIDIPFRLQIRSFNKTELTPSRRTEKASPKSADTITISKSDLLSKVYHPVCKTIKEYFDKLIRASADKADALILVGGFRHTTYLLNEIRHLCSQLNREIVIPFHDEKNNSEYRSFETVCGAIFMSMDTSAAQDPVPQIEYDTENQDLLTKAKCDVLVFIAMSMDQMEHITEWPGQESFYNTNFPTLDVILIPDQTFEKQLYDLEGEQSYFSFERDEHGINLISHYKSKMKDSIKPVSEYEFEEKYEVSSSEEIDDLDVQVNNNCYNDIDSFLKYRPLNKNYRMMRYVTKFEFHVKRERITFKEFMTLYLRYLNAFLCTYISKRTEHSDFKKYRYCIMRDDHAAPDTCKLSDKELQDVLKYSGITGDNPHDYKALLLNRAEASAIYCRTLIPPKTLQNRKNEIYFLQVYMYPGQCILLLNDIPATLDKGSKDVYEDWVGMYKHVKAKSISIDVMDQICNHLWTHLQTYTDEQAADMAFLDIQDSEKTHIIYICNGTHDCCSISLSNMDLLDFAINPALNNLVSVIQASTQNQDLFRDIQLSDIFLMGEFLVCRDQISYKFIERRLVSKLKEINFRRLDSLILLGKAKDTQVQKVKISIPDLEGTCSIAHAVSIGAFHYTLDPRNRLLERYTNRTYALSVSINDPEEPIDVEVHRPQTDKRTKLGHLEYFRIIEKNTRVSDFTNYEINNYINLSRGTNCKIDIGLYGSDENNITSWSMTNKSFDHIHTFTMKDGYQDNSYPIVLRVLLSQTKSIRFWVTYGKEIDLGAPINIRENIQLKSYINK